MTQPNNYVSSPQTLQQLAPPQQNFPFSNLPPPYVPNFLHSQAPLGANGQFSFFTPVYVGPPQPGGIHYNYSPLTYSELPPQGQSKGSPQDLKVIEDYIVSLLKGPKQEITEENLLPSTTVPEKNQAEQSSLSQTNQVAQRNNLQWKKKYELEDENFQQGEKDSDKATNQLPLIKGPDLGKLNAELTTLYNFLKPSESEFNKRLKLLERLQRIVSNLWRDTNASLHLFGSSANQFGLKSADMDISLIIDTTVGSQQQVIKKLGDALRRKGMKQVCLLPKARVPIAKFTDSQTSISCDICINNVLALHNTQLIAEYAKIDERVREVGIIVKYWAKRRQINEPYSGTLSSYAYILMVIHFMQQRNPPILPCLQQMSDSNHPPYRVDVDGYNCYFYTNIDALKGFGKANIETSGELLAGFFKFYATLFNWDNDVISVRSGRFLTKEEKVWKPVQNFSSRDNYFFTIEDPFETTHNLGRVVDKQGLKVIKYEFKRAHKLLTNKESLRVVTAKYTEGEK